MNRIEAAFQNKKAFIPFVTGGDPDTETTEKLVLGMEEAGADIIEIGVPFSDPIAEGVVIQDASKRALANWCTADKLFGMVRRLRRKTEIPLLFMTYYNPVHTYGKERFLCECQSSGIDGLIVPDLPFEEKDELSAPCREHGLALISMIAPTSGERIAMIASGAQGFLYCVSSLGVTGVRGEISTDLGAMIRKVRSVSNIPCAVGFGVSTPEQARQTASLADGVIVGSAIVRLVAQCGKGSVEPVKNFVAQMKAAMNNK
ncbi:MAG: tryptophan synthase subunit alpha [Clostridiales bacterium]|nr:tryptophan synthase subunit alpha [Clostridiales bacterium]